MPTDPAGTAAFYHVSEPVGVLAVLLGVLALVFWCAQHPRAGRLFQVVPALIFCYFVPTLLTTLGVLPEESSVYSWIKDFVLPASLVLLILALDVPGILRLGPKALIMFLAGTAGVVIGGPIAFLLLRPWLPPDAWQGMSALSGSWIGGGANYIAVGRMAEASNEMMGLMVIPDVFVANVWTAVLLWMATREKAIDRRTRADSGAIRALEERLTEFHEKTSRTASLGDLVMLLALGFVPSWLSHVAARAIGAYIASQPSLERLGDYMPTLAWKYILVTTFGVALSFTRARNMEGVGASKIGSVMLYLLVACIGAGANFTKLGDVKVLILAAAVWMVVHIAVLVAVGLAIRAPLFMFAVGSQANIGGAASAPVVAAAFHPRLAPVGVLFAVLGYVLGTYMGWVCMLILKSLAGA